MESQRKRMLFWILPLMVVILSVLVWYRRRSAHEDFQGNSILIHNIANDGAPRFSNQSLDKRPCALFFTSNVDACNDTTNAWYQMPFPLLEETIRNMESSGANANQIAQAKLVKEERANDQLPNGICKLQFRDWVEPTTDHTGTPLPMKHAGIENQLRGNTQNWAFCYSEGNHAQDVQQKSQRFSDGQVVFSDSYVGTPFQDGKTYGRVSFGSMRFHDSFCAKPILSPENIPSSWIVLKPAQRSQHIESMRFASYNSQTQSMEPYENMDVVFASLFDTVLTDKAELVVKPRKLPAKIYYFQFDPCKRVAFMGPQQKDIDFSMIHFGASEQHVLFRSASPTDDTYGTLEQLQELSQSPDTDPQRKLVIDESIAVIQTKLKQYIATTLQQMVLSQPSNLDFRWVSNDQNIYIDVGPFADIAALQQQRNNAQIVRIVYRPFQVCQGNVMKTIPIQDVSTVRYSVCFWIRIETPPTEPLHMMLHGKNTSDYCPSIWLTPNEPRLRIVHQTSSGGSTQQNEIVSSILPLQTWIPVVVRANGSSETQNGTPPNTMQLWIDGVMDQQMTLVHPNTWVWGDLSQKRFVVGAEILQGKNMCDQANVVLNHVLWYSSPLENARIAQFGTIIPRTVNARSLQNILTQATGDGIFDMQQGNDTIKLYVKTMHGRKWALVLSYHHKAGTNPELRVIQNGQNWPFDLGLPLGTDGSIEARTDGETGVSYSAGSAWGHVSPNVLKDVNVQEMLWYGKNAQKEIHFTTSDRAVIEYCKTGKGGFPIPFTNYESKNGDSSMLPRNATHRLMDQGEYAMTELPFWRWGFVHWGIRADGQRWEVDDFANGFQRDTIHQVWIR